MNMGQIMMQYQQFRQNPMQMLSRAGIPQNIMNDPNAIIQYMMNSGRLSQAQYNQAVQMARQLQGR